MLAQPLGQEDPLEEGMLLSHSSICAWRTLWAEGPGGLQSQGPKESGRLGQDKRLTDYTRTQYLSGSDVLCYEYLILSSPHNQKVNHVRGSTFICEIHFCMPPGLSKAPTTQKALNKYLLSVCIYLRFQCQPLSSKFFCRSFLICQVSLPNVKDHNFEDSMHEWVRSMSILFPSIC